MSALVAAETIGVDRSSSRPDADPILLSVMALLSAGVVFAMSVWAARKDGEEDRAWAESLNGGGARIAFTLPLAADGSN